MTAVVGDLRSAADAEAPALPPARIAEVVREAYAVRATGVPLPLTKRRTSRAPFRIDTADGTFLVRYATGRDREALTRDLGVTAALAGTSAAKLVPRVVHTQDGGLWTEHGGVTLGLVEFVQGRSAKPARDEDAPSPTLLETLGAGVAAVHQGLAECAGSETAAELVPSTRGVIDELAAGLPHPAAVAQLDGAAPPARLHAALDAAREALDRQQPPARVHGDLRYSNLLFRSGRLVAVLDYEDAGTAPLALDHAIALRNLATDESVRPSAGALRGALVEAYLRGYRSVRTVTEQDERATLSLFGVAAATELHYLLMGGGTCAPAMRRAHLVRVAARQLVRWHERVHLLRDRLGPEQMWQGLCGA